MAIFKYRPFYQFNGPSHSNPLREELSSHEIGRRMSLFFDEIGNYFRDVGAQVEPAGDGVISITTDLSEADCDARVVKCLNGLDLFGQKIPG